MTVLCVPHSLDSGDCLVCAVFAGQFPLQSTLPITEHADSGTKKLRLSWEGGLVTPVRDGGGQLRLSVKGGGQLRLSREGGFSQPGQARNVSRTPTWKQ